MSRPFSLRTWSTPLTIGTSILMSVTGVMMFFEWNIGLTTVVHQWFSWLFLLGIGGHIAVNIRPFSNHLTSFWGRTSITVFTVALVASFVSWGFITGPQLERPIEQALVDAPLSALAGVAGLGREAVLLRLKAHGIDASVDQSLGALSRTSGVGENRLLGIIFLGD